MVTYYFQSIKLLFFVANRLTLYSCCMFHVMKDTTLFWFLDFYTLKDFYSPFYFIFGCWWLMRVFNGLQISLGQCFEPWFPFKQHQWFLLFLQGNCNFPQGLIITCWYINSLTVGSNSSWSRKHNTSSSTLLRFFVSIKNFGNFTKIKRTVYRHVYLQCIDSADDLN